MGKWRKGLACIAMAAALLLSAVPADAARVALPETQVQPSEPTRIKQQIKDIYRKARRWNGGSMAGYCGRASDYQMYLLGINSHLEFRDGKNQFDRYCNSDVTTGGYYIAAYPSASYDLESGLNAISYYGSKDVYNILVGFEWTHTAAGNIYGHTCFIHAILDGKVYFTESYGMYLTGRYYAEGEPAVCTIKEFAEYYNKWTRFDGLIHFTKDSYVNECANYPASLYVQVTQDAALKTQPRTDGENDQLVRIARQGERLKVTDLYQNTHGEFWYRAEENYNDAYIPADSTKLLSFRYEDVVLKDAKAPSRLWQGNMFNVRGVISTVENRLTGAAVQIYSRTDGSMMMEHRVDLDCRSYDLFQQEMLKNIKFQTLPYGDYIYKILATTESYYISNGELVLKQTEHTLWTSNFVVNHSSSIYKTVFFNGAGGEVSVTQLPVVYKKGLAFLPTATREGYRFDGWFLEDGTMVTMDTTFRKDITVYAHWTKESPAVEGWHQVDGEWFHFHDGEALTGWFADGDALYYLTEAGMRHSGWMDLEEDRYYFCASGTAQRGWMELGGKLYYFYPDGRMATGWVYLDGAYRYFCEDGCMEKDQVREVPDLALHNAALPTAPADTANTWQTLCLTDV